MLSSPISFIFFALFALILVITYLAIRREWAQTGIIAGLSLAGSIIAMLLVSFSQGNAVFQAIVVSLIMGALFSLATVAIALFFHTNEMREKHRQSPVGESE